MYNSPIQMIQLQTMRDALNFELENAVVKEVQKVGIYIDKEELTKALQADRRRYEEAYKAGWHDCERQYEGRLQRIREALNQTEEETEEEEE